MAETYDLIVIGAGPGGYIPALKAAGWGKRTAVVERRELGGTCLNRGCIPTKTLLHTSELYRACRNASAAGLRVEGAAADAAVLQARKEEVVKTLRDGIGQQFKKNKIDAYQGSGMITAPSHVQVTAADGTVTELEAEHILIATGSVPSIPPIEGADLPGVLDSDLLLSKADGFFDRLLIIGGGVIGMEFATIYSDLGRQVTVIEALDRILPAMDREFSQNLKMIMKKRGVDIHTGAVVKRIEKTDGGLSCIYEEKGTEASVEADGILIATGRRADTDGLFAAETGLLPDMDRGRILVDEHYRTSIPGIYAAGDVIGGIQLAHAASAEGCRAVAHMFGEQETGDMRTVPSCVYTDPEIASVGLTADEAKEKNIPVKTGKYIMSVNGKSVLSMQERGFIKLVADSGTGRILGGQMMCARATDIIGEIGLAIAKGLTAGDLAEVIMAHPTFSEGIGEAAAEVLKK